MVDDENRIVSYEHHGQRVFTRASTKGTHRDLCLCYICDDFGIEVDNPEASDKSKCPIAEANYQNCVKYGTVQPVLECPRFSLKEGLEGEFVVVDGE